MRIRKRYVLFSSLHDSTAAPPSDPHLNHPERPPVVQLADAAATPEPSAVLSLDLGRQPSDQINGWDDPSGEGGAHKQLIKQDPSDDGGVGRQEIGEDGSGEKKDHSRKGGIFESQTLPPPQSPPSNQDERWSEEEKTIPLKKRRDSFQNSTTTGAGNNSKTKVKVGMKTKNIDDEEDYCVEEEKEAREANKNGGGGGKKRKRRGSAAMEGSRCSRVNGRGWRCSQQTLVGYSLCEHHLGKGRLRSMTSVRNRSKSVVIPASATSPPPPTTTTTKEVAVVQPQQDDEYPLSSSPSSSSSPKKQSTFVAEGDVNIDEKNKKPAIVAKKRMMKIGTVKARSISSLLEQTNTTAGGIAAISHESNK